MKSQPFRSQRGETAGFAAFFIGNFLIMIALRIILYIFIVIYRSEMRFFEVFLPYFQTFQGGHPARLLTRIKKSGIIEISEPEQKE